jgi:hypothetical protein
LDGARLVVFEEGECVLQVAVRPDAPLPIPPGHRCSTTERHAGFTVARFDRVRVLMTEIKRLTAIGAPVSVRFGVGRPLTGARLARVFAWL